MIVVLNFKAMFLVTKTHTGDVLIEQFNGKISDLDDENLFNQCNVKLNFDIIKFLPHDRQFEIFLQLTKNEKNCLI